MGWLRSHSSHGVVLSFRILVGVAWRSSSYAVLMGRFSAQPFGQHGLGNSASFPQPGRKEEFMAACLHGSSDRGVWPFQHFSLQKLDLSSKQQQQPANSHLYKKGQSTVKQGACNFLAQRGFPATANKSKGTGTSFLLYLFCQGENR